jgi:hypothetical protein
MPTDILIDSVGAAVQRSEHACGIAARAIKARDEAKKRAEAAVAILNGPEEILKQCGMFEKYEARAAAAEAECARLTAQRDAAIKVAEGLGRRVGQWPLTEMCWRHLLSGIGLTHGRRRAPAQLCMRSPPLPRSGAVERNQSPAARSAQGDRMIRVLILSLLLSSVAFADHPKKPTPAPKKPAETGPRGDREVPTTPVRPAPKG